MSDLVGSSIEEITQEDFDPQNQYSTVVDSVRQAGSGDVGFYKAELDSIRTQYLVVSLDAKYGRLVGLKALAVES
jgi:hypothetical protein